MKTKTLMIAGMAFALIGTSQAEEGKKDHPHRELPPEVIKRFDKDADGKLNEEERKAAREAHEERMKERRKEMLKEFDKDGDGELNEEEKSVMYEEMKKRALKKFDKDGDGELSDEERAEMRKEWGDRRGPGGKDGKRGNGRDKGEPENDGDDEAPGVLGE